MKTMKTLCLLAICLMAGNSLSAQWTRIEPFTGNTLLDVAFSGSLTGVAVGENGSVYRTADGGDIWELISPEKDITFTSVAVTSETSYYVSGFKTFDDGSGITKLFATTDGGLSWEVINSYDVVGEPCQVRCENGNIWFLAAWKGLQKSTDSGLTWQMVFRGGGNTVLTDLETDPANPASVFVFGTIGGFATYSTQFRHSAGNAKWETPDPFDFDNTSAYTAFTVINDTVLIFRNFYDRFMPDDTSNVLSVLYDFTRDDILPGGATGDTCWHFKVKTVNSDIPHYVNDCHFFSLGGLGYTVENAGGINRTLNGGTDWINEYRGIEPLNALFMVSDSVGFAVGGKGTILKRGTGSSGIENNTDKGLTVKVFPSPADNEIVIETGLSAKPATVVITDGSGRMVATFLMTGSTSRVDVSTWSNGIYFVTVNQSGKTAVKRVVRESPL
jgi:photosystem II stability/assembly factor-like uncharacterized protein